MDPAPFYRKARKYIDSCSANQPAPPLVGFVISTPISLRVIVGFTIIYCARLVPKPISKRGDDGRGSPAPTGSIPIRKSTDYYFILLSANVSA